MTPALSKIAAPPALRAFKASELTLSVVRASELQPYEAAWSELSEQALERNPFYEPWMLLPAIQHLAGDANLQVVLVFAPEKKGAQLLGLFPLEVRRECLHLPVRSLSFWQHLYCFLTVPLVHRDHAQAVLEMFWQWWGTHPFGCRVFDTRNTLAEGPFHQIWCDLAYLRSSLTLHEYSRASLRPSGTADTYIAAAISKKHLDEYRRLERKLRELDRWEYCEVSDRDQLESWMSDFLRIEAGGWKGNDAIAAKAGDRQFFLDVSRRGFAENRVTLLYATLGGVPIALKFNLISGDAGYTFKIAFDEQYAKYSPGVLLELENIRRTFRNTRPAWQDSCAGARHFMIDRLWSERRMIRRTLYSDGSAFGDFIISALPLLRWASSRMRRRKNSVEA